MWVAPSTSPGGYPNSVSPNRDEKNDRFFAPADIILLWFLGFLISLVISAFHSQIVPPKFDRDSQVIQQLLAVPGLAGYEDFGSFRTIAWLYQSLGLANNAALAGFVGVVVAQSALAVALWRMRPIRATPLSIGGLALYALFVGVYQGVYTKEIIISTVVMVVAAAPTDQRSGWVWDCILTVIMAVLGQVFRPYWTLIAVVFLGLRIFVSNTGFSRRRIRVRQFILLMGLCSLLLAVAVASTGVPADHFRTMVNEGRGADTGSLIGRFLEGPEPIAGVVNVLFATVMLMFPLMLAIKLSPYYLLIFLVIASFWGGYFYSVRRWLCNEYRRALIARAVCLIAAFASVQGLFEPDYGSALRHLTPLIPMFFIILAGEQGGENNRKIGRRVVNESMFPVNGSSLYYPQQMPHNSHISPPSNSSGIQYPPPLSSSP